MSALLIALVSFKWLTLGDPVRYKHRCSMHLPTHGINVGKEKYTLRHTDRAENGTNRQDPRETVTQTIVIVDV